MTLALATRGSDLALWQAEAARAALLRVKPDLPTALVVVQSAGDRDRETELARFGLTGVFTAEVDQAVLSRRARVGVHSLKDVPTTLHAELVLCATLPRGPVEDVLVSRDGRKLAELPRGARIATGSVRRAAMLRRVRDDLDVVPIRGNVETRVDKILRGEADAVVLARAGLERLKLADRIAEVLPLDVVLCAPSQGIVGLVTRRDDTLACDLVCHASDPDALRAALAERALLAGLRAGCSAPVGALARVEGGRVTLVARVLSPDGREMIESSGSGPGIEAERIGADLARELLDRGAARLIELGRSR